MCCLFGLIDYGHSLSGGGKIECSRCLHLPVRYGEPTPPVLHTMWEGRSTSTSVRSRPTACGSGPGGGPGDSGAHPDDHPGQRKAELQQPIPFLGWRETMCLPWPTTAYCTMIGASAADYTCPGQRSRQTATLPCSS